MAGDGQVTLGEGVIKHSAKKIRRLYQDKILAGFAGSTADAFTLFSRFESKLEQYHGNLGRGAVELAKDWRTDKFLRHLEALLLVADKEQTFLLVVADQQCAEILPRPLRWREATDDKLLLVHALELDPGAAATTGFVNRTHLFADDALESQSLHFPEKRLRIASNLSRKAD